MGPPPSRPPATTTPERRRGQGARRQRGYLQHPVTCRGCPTPAERGTDPRGESRSVTRLGAPKRGELAMLGPCLRLPAPSRGQADAPAPRPRCAQHCGVRSPDVRDPWPAAACTRRRSRARRRRHHPLGHAGATTWVVPRLTGRPKAALMEVQSDEYGGGDPTPLHHRLFERGLEASGLQHSYGAYVDEALSRCWSRTRRCRCWTPPASARGRARTPALLAQWDSACCACRLTTTCCPRDGGPSQPA